MRKGVDSIANDFHLAIAAHVSRQQHPRLSGLTNAITATRKTTLDRDSFETILGSWLDTYFGPEPVAEEMVAPEPVVSHERQVLMPVAIAE